MLRRYPLLEFLEPRTHFAATVPHVSVTAPTKRASENGDIRSFILSRTGDTSANLVLNISITGTATNGIDFGVIGTRITIPAGTTSVKIPIRPIDDDLIESSESVTLTLRRSARYKLTEASSDYIKIFDNDSVDARMKITWSEVAPSPQWRSEAEKGVISGKLYLFGGFIEGNDGPQVRSDVYDPKTNTWTRIADLPTRVTHGGTAVDGTKVYICGGFVGTGPFLGQQDYGTTDVWIYDAGTNAFSKAPALPAPRGSGACVRIGRELHFMGGVDLQRVDHADHWILDLDHPEQGWKKSTPLPEPRNHFATAVVDGKIYVIGGQLGDDDATGAKTNLWLFNPSTSTWQILPNLPQPMAHVTEATIVHRGRILIFGGIAPGGSLIADVNAYNSRTGVWSKLTPLPAPRYTGDAAVIDDVIYFAGGTSATTYKGVLS
jgi:N-acetylneuraminic acid mutarotase